LTESQVSKVDAVLTRFTADGDLDATFGQDGRVEPQSGNATPEDVAIQEDGKIVMVAARQGGRKVFVGRFNSDGGPDASFSSGGDGLRSLELTLRNIWLGQHALEITRKGKIVIVGSAKRANSSQRRVMLIRLKANGKRDRSFGRRGVVLAPRYLASEEYADDVVELPGRRLAVAGSTHSNRDRGVNAMLVAKFKPDGQPDRSFGDNGFRAVAFGASPKPFLNAYALDKGKKGRLVIAGRHEINKSQGAFARLTKNGRLDRSFSDDGRQLVDIDGGLDVANDVRVDGAGRIIAAAGDRKAGLLRLRPNGSRDRDFGKRGIAPIGFKDGADRGAKQAIAVTKQRILLAMTADTSTKTLDKFQALVAGVER
jgi:uncharacterized delta-60 repeat protein